MKVLTAYSTSSSHSLIPFEVLDISRLPGGDGADEEGSLEGGGKTKAVIMAR